MLAMLTESKGSKSKDNTKFLFKGTDSALLFFVENNSAIVFD